MLPIRDNRITDKAKIREIMHAYMLKPHEQKAPRIAAIFSREHRKGGIIYEGARVISACTIESHELNGLMIARETEYTIMSGYRESLKLSLIEYIEILED